MKKKIIENTELLKEKHILKKLVDQREEELKKMREILKKQKNFNNRIENFHLLDGSRANSQGKK